MKIWLLPLMLAVLVAPAISYGLSITMDSPLGSGHVYNYNNISVNFTISTDENETIDKCWIAWNGAFDNPCPYPDGCELLDCKNTTIFAVPCTNYIGLFVNITNGTFACSAGCEFLQDWFVVASDEVNLTDPKNETYPYSPQYVPLNTSIVFKNGYNQYACEFKLDDDAWQGMMDCLPAFEGIIAWEHLSEAQHHVQVRMGVDYCEGDPSTMSYSPDVYFTVGNASVDYGYVNITMQHPVNAANYYLTNQSVNFTFDTNETIDRCWMVWDKYPYGGANYSIANCLNTTILAGECVNYLGLAINTTAGKTNWTHGEEYNLDFFMVTSSRATYQSPSNTTYPLQDIDVNYTTSSNGTVADCYYTLDDSNPLNAQPTCIYPGCCDLTLSGLNAGQHYVTIYIYTLESEYGTSPPDPTCASSDTVYFTLADLTPPTVTIQSPSGTVTSPFDISFEASDDVATDSCWYSLDSGGNVSLSACDNSTAMAADGGHALIVYANDTSGNVGQADVSFTVTTPVSPPITGSTAVMVGLVMLMLVAGIIVVIIRQIDEMKDMHDLIGLAVMTLIAVALAVFAIVFLTGLI